MTIRSSTTAELAAIARRLAATGLSDAQIAEAMGLSVGAVRELLARGSWIGR